MSAAEVVTVVAAGTLVVLSVALLASLVSLRRALADARRAVEHLHDRAVPALDDMRRAVRRAERDVGRLDDLITTADSIGRTADAASRLAYESISNPVIKALAFGAGTRRAARRLRGVDDPSTAGEPEANRNGNGRRGREEHRGRRGAGRAAGGRS